MEYSENIRIHKARKKLEELKRFYNHLVVYLIVNIFLFVIRGNILDFFENKSPDKNFLEWVDWNILIVPIFWGIGLLFHAFCVFQHRFRFLKNWEEKKLKEFMDAKEAKNIL